MPLPWAAKRQIIILMVLTLAILLILSGVIYFFYKKTSNTAPENNPASAKNISILWARVFPEREGFVDAAAFLENPNLNFGAKKFVYAFRIYDSNNVLIAIKENQTIVNPGERFVVFEPSISIENRLALKAILEIKSLSWESAAPSPILQINTLRKDIFSGNELPRAEITVKNQANESYRNIEATLVLFSSLGDAVAASQTVIDALAIGEEKKIVFTWPGKIPEAASLQIFFRKLP